MALQQIKLEIDRTYKDGNGDHIKIVFHDKRQGLFRCEDGYRFYPNGVFADYEDEEFNLIEEVKD